MIKVDVITEGAWIKYFWASKIVEAGHPGVEFRLRTEPDNQDPPDVNLWVDYNVFLHFPKTAALDVGYVTHLHMNDPVAHSRDMCLPFGRFFEMDAFIHQSTRSMEQWVNLGFSQPSYHLRNAIDAGKFCRTITIGCFQNLGATGKGSQFMLDLVRSYDLTNYKLIVIGKDWGPVLQEMDARGYRYELIEFNQAQYFLSKTSEVYERLRYYLVPSLYEGGPVGAVEAAACGVPLISSDVGLCREIPGSLLFCPGDVEGLCDILDDIQGKHYAVPLSFSDFNSRLYEILSPLLNTL